MNDQDWVDETHAEGLAISLAGFSASGRWFDFNVVSPYQDIEVLENGLIVDTISGMDEAVGWVVGFTGVEL